MLRQIYCSFHVHGVKGGTGILISSELNEHIFSKIYQTIVKEIHEKSTAAKSISEETRQIDQKCPESTEKHRLYVWSSSTGQVHHPPHHHHHADQHPLKETGEKK